MMQATVAYIEADNGVIAFLLDQNSSREWVRLYSKREDAALEALHHNLLTQSAADHLLSCLSTQLRARRRNYCNQRTFCGDGCPWTRFGGTKHTSIRGNDDNKKSRKK